jgi:signal transduction histidine kinase
MILLTIQDITVRKQQEQEILEKQRQVAELTEEVLLTEERERRQIATALHDSIGQSLAFSKRELAALCKDLPAELSEKFDQVKTQIDEAIRETRSLTFDLSPATLYTFGLEAALEELAEQFSQREGFKCHFQAEEGDRPLSEQSKVLLYRATRELLINVAKHAAARNVHVRIKRATQNVQIEVEDDGKGFDLARLEPVQGKQPGFGLFSIRERLAHTKGTFDIRSVPGDGTIITMQAALQTTEGNDSRRASS